MSVHAGRNYKHKTIIYCMKLPNKTKIALATAALCVTTLGAGAAYAATTDGFERGSCMDGIASSIATRFNLNKAEVQAVFDEQFAARKEMRAEHRAERQTERDALFSERISQAVANGELTQAQADLLLEKKAEVNAAREEMGDLVGPERGEAMREQMDALRVWAEDNDIPTEFFGGFGPGKGMRGGMFRGMGSPGVLRS
jgi:hypothetical protein